MCFYSVIIAHYKLSLHDALPIFKRPEKPLQGVWGRDAVTVGKEPAQPIQAVLAEQYHRLPVVHPADRSAHHQKEDVTQRVPEVAFVCTSGIGHLPKDGDKS